MIKKSGAIAALAVLAALIFLCQAGGALLRERLVSGQETSGVASGRGDYLIIIDPGHGGLDAGKVGVNGKEEKDINLNISLKVKELLKQHNIKTKMTRTGDERLAENQVQDLKERTDLMNKEKPDLVVSIHQNSYHEESVSGAQVFYYTDSRESERAAGLIQEALKEVDPENTKKAKGNNTYYILKKTEVPVVIVECGFLSNYGEAEKLADEAYQQELAEAIVRGAVQYLEGKGGA